jgi:hypothetical protein
MHNAFKIVTISEKWRAERKPEHSHGQPEALGFTAVHKLTSDDSPGY